MAAKKHNVALDPLNRYLDSVSYFTNLNKKSLYSSAFRSKLNGQERATTLFEEYSRRVTSGNSLDTLLYLDSKTYLPGDILTKVDRMSMAVSLEARVPLLDHKLIEFVTRIPSHFKIKGAATKHILKRAVRGLVPDEILDRPKQGFGLPIQKWINKELRGYIRDVLFDQRTRERGYFNQDYVVLLLNEHDRSRRDHTAPLWALFMLELWHRIFVDAPSDAVNVGATIATMA